VSNPRFRREVYAHYLAKNEDHQKFPKVIAMISLSSTGICGDEDFRYGERGTPGHRREWQESFKARSDGYDMDMRKIFVL
jgi:hypothetical protein